MQAAAVDKEGRCARNPAGVSAFDVFADALGVAVFAQLGGEAFHVQSQRFRVTAQVGRREMFLVIHQQVVHLPEGALGAGRLGGLGRQLGARVDVDQGEVTEGETQVVSVALDSSRIIGSARPQ